MVVLSPLLVALWNLADVGFQVNHLVSDVGQVVSPRVAVSTLQGSLFSLLGLDVGINLVQFVPQDCEIESDLLTVNDRLFRSPDQQLPDCLLVKLCTFERFVPAVVHVLGDDFANCSV